MTVAKAMAFAALILVSTACCPQKPTDPLAGCDKDKLIHCTGEPAYLGWCMNACATWEHLQTGQKSDWPFGPIVKSDRLNIIKPVYRPTINAEPPPDPRLPPKEFDKPYIGLGAFIVRRGSEVDLHENCRMRTGKPMFENGKSALGCAMRGVPTKDDCTIYIADDYVLQRWSATYDIVYRHERAHCNNAQHDEQGRWLK
jgi:hypothetical protein